jgi:NADH-quinone oxidoreductase subunit E
MSKQVQLPNVWMIALGVFIVAFVLLMVIGYAFLAALFFALCVALAVAIFFMLVRDRAPRSEGMSASTGAAGTARMTPAPAAKAAGSETSYAPPRSEKKPEAAPAAPLVSNAPEPAPGPAAAPAPDAQSAPAEEKEPIRLDAPREGAADDLKRIKGIGPKIEGLLNSMGIYHLDQIASWGPAEVAWMDEHLEDFRGRVSRDDWVAQARHLSGGGETEFSRRVDEGEVYD